MSLSRILKVCWKSRLRGKLLTFWEIEKILKREVERRPRLNESFGPNKKPTDRSWFAQMLDSFPRSLMIIAARGRFSPICPDGARAWLRWPGLAPSIHSATPFLIFARLITRDSPPTSASIFDVSLPSTPRSTFNGWSLQISRSIRLPKSRCDGPQPTSPRLPPDGRHAVPPGQSTWFRPDELRRRMRFSHFRRGPRAVLHGDTSRPIRSAGGLLRAVRVGRGELMGRNASIRERDPGDVRLRRLMVGIMFWEWIASTTHEKHTNSFRHCPKPFSEA
jgi:hypothetical protein